MRVGDGLVLVTAGTGFIGSRLVERFVGQRARVWLPFRRAAALTDRIREDVEAKVVDKRQNGSGRLSPTPAIPSKSFLLTP